MTATPEGPEYANLPWCPVDPAHDDELARKAYVDGVAGGVTIVKIPGLRAKLDELKRQFNSVAAVLAGKMPTAPTDGKDYAGQGGSWVQRAVMKVFNFDTGFPSVVAVSGQVCPVTGTLMLYFTFSETTFYPNMAPTYRINGVEHSMKVISSKYNYNNADWWSYTVSVRDVPISAGDVLDGPLHIPAFDPDASALTARVEYYE